MWLAQGKKVAALTRSKTDELRSQGIETILGDVLNVESLKALPKAKTVLYAVGMDRSAGRSFREVYVDGLKNVLQHLPAPERFLYVSSTGVYGQTGGEEIEESSPTVPLEDNGKTILEAEATLHQHLPGAIILRFAGIYGPGREIRRANIERGELIAGYADKWLNLIHVEDGARAYSQQKSTDDWGKPISSRTMSRYGDEIFTRCWPSCSERRHPIFNPVLIRQVKRIDAF